VLKPHFMGLVAVAAATSCTASWGGLVHYSTRPQPPDVGPLVGVYEAVLHDTYRARSPDDSILLNTQVAGHLPVAAMTSFGGVALPGYWPDSLKQELAVALASPQLSTEGDPGAIRAAAALLGAHITPAGAAIAAESVVVHKISLVRLSGVGFNRDSTIAVVRTSFWCGIICGAGQTLLLARRPGYEWHVWHSILHWVS
jgi:hypothetical protein